MAIDRKVIVVTGASSGIGNAIATLLAKRGFRVLGTCRNPDTHPKKADEFFDLVAMDVTQDASVTTAFKSILEDEHRIDALICCAGSGIAGSVEETSIEEAKAQFEVNYFGTLRSIKAVLPHFRAAGAGRIVVVSSIAGLIGLPFQSFYSSTKFALEGFVEGLRLEVRPFGIAVSLVEPGDFRTGFTASRTMAAAYLSAGTASPYFSMHEAVLGQQAKDEQAGHDPLEAARLVERLILAGHPAVRYSTGPRFQRFAAKLKAFLPSRVFESLLGMIYHL